MVNKHTYIEQEPMQLSLQQGPLSQGQHGPLLHC